jgi:hypothetical protein
LCNAGNLNTEDLGPRLAAMFVHPTATPTPVAASPDDGVASIAAGTYRIVETGVPVRVDARDNSISFGGPKLAYVGNHTFESVGGTRTATVTIVDGRVSQIDVSRQGNTRVVLRPVRVWTPLPSEMRSFEGIYYNAELDASYSVRARPNELELTGPNDTRIVLRPAYSDVFVAPDGDWTVSFSRANESGTKTMRFTATRVRNVRFTSTNTIVR